MVSSLLQLKEVKSIKDFLGNELNIGDEVVALAHQRTSSTLLNEHGIACRHYGGSIDGYKVLVADILERLKCPGRSFGT